MKVKLTVTQENVRVFPMHSHPTWEFMCYIKGEGKLATEQGDFPFAEGTVIAIPPGILHGSRSEQAFVNICIHAELQMPSEKIYHIPDGKRQKSIFESAEALYRQGERYSAALSMLILSLKELILTEEQQERGTDRAVQAVYDCISERFAEKDFSVSRCIGKTGYSQDHFREKFKQSFGMTPTQYLTKQRVEYAEDLMRTYGKNLKIEEIAELCGFSDPLYFSRVFKSRHGSSPSFFLKKWSAKQEQ